MAVTLTLSGVNAFHGEPETHTVPDGATIAIRRLHDGFLSLVVTPAEAAPVAKEAEATDGPEQNINGHTPDGKAFERRRSAPDPCGLTQAQQTKIAASILRRLYEAQKAGAADRQKSSTEDEAMNDIRQVMENGAAIIVVGPLG